VSADLTLDSVSRDGCALLTVGGEVDLGTAGELSDAAIAAMQDISPQLVIDLSAVTFMDSTGLKVLLAMHKRADLAGGRLVLVGLTRSVDKVITVTGLDQTFHITDSVDSALTMAAQPPATDAAASD
jgi:anti-anti-sigma factor